MYDHILVPISPDEPVRSSAALKFAQAMLNEGGEITVVTVMEVPPPYVVNYLPDGQVETVLAEEGERLAAEVAGLASVTSKILPGHPARAILDEAEALGVDSIVIASHRPGPQHFFLGSTATRVVRRARCPVHVLR
jgi:nucleotide-binding universal stress UspA family protein